MSSDIFRRLHPNFLPYVKAVLSNGHIGVIGGPVRFAEPLSGCISSRQKENNCDRFKIHIPYAGRNISWQIIFNSQNVDEPPDFIFGQDDEEFVPELEEIKCLVNWNPGDENSLLYVLREIVCLYREHQQTLLEVNPRFQFEYTSLLDTKIYADFEVHQGRKVPGVRDVPINFLIRLPINFHELPEFIIKENPGEDVAILLVSYQNQAATKILPQLYLSPRIEHALGGSSSLRIPSFPADSCLLDYIPHVCELLQNMVEQISKGYRRRKEYIAAFLSHYGKSVLEYDIEGFYKISFLFENYDFFCTVHIELPTYFPREQPVIHFQSIYHFDVYGKPFSSVIRNYPYSPRWTGNEMAQRVE
ncbi:BRISC and BRCA1-A complex member 2-like [Anneissia japonica]|uniref:BRISC and BRCA1-A complex member 2-like n=1 Tax=Anneissia japonica TaxID=1529436 RepID=UPI001425A639|nr:BRISC and BRCA1-A complex member 2-like [Anneissia japonica]